MDETKMNMYQNDWKRKVWRGKETAPDLNYTTFTVKHGGGGIVMYGYQWNGSLVQSDDVTEDSSWMNSEVYLAILSAQIQPNTAALLMTMQIDDDPKYIIHPFSEMEMQHVVLSTGSRLQARLGLKLC